MKQIVRRHFTWIVYGHSWKCLNMNRSTYIGGVFLGCFRCNNQPMNSWLKMKMDFPLHIWQTKLELKWNISVVRVLHKFLMEISELDSHKCLILIKVLLVAEHLKCQNHMMFACQNVFAFSFAFAVFCVCFFCYSRQTEKNRIQKNWNGCDILFTESFEFVFPPWPCSI